MTCSSPTALGTKAGCAGELLQRLDAAGLKTFIDFRDFDIGAPSLTEMERGVLTSRKTLLVLSPAYLESQWTEFETLVVQTLDPASRQRRLIPLRKERCELPLRIGMLTYVDFADPSELDVGGRSCCAGWPRPTRPWPRPALRRRRWLIHLAMRCGDYVRCWRVYTRIRGVPTAWLTMLAWMLPRSTGMVLPATIGMLFSKRPKTMDNLLLGAAHRVNHDLAAADRHLTEALTRCRAINLVEFEADILLDLARLRWDQAELDAAQTAALQAEALALAQEALVITERSGFVLQGADVRLFLAHAAHAAGDLHQAREHAIIARDLAYCDGPPYSYQVAYDEALAWLARLAEAAP